MAQSIYNVEIPLGYAGSVLDLNPKELVSGIATAEIDMGVGVTRGTAEGTVDLGAASAAAFYGIAVRDITREANNDGTITYAPFDSVAIMRRGYIRVTLGASGAVAPGDAVFMNPTTGTFAASGATGHSVDLSAVATFEKSGSNAGDLVQIRVA